MGAQYTFYDYINDQGVNVIHDWLNNIGSGKRDRDRAKARFNNTLLHLQGDYPVNWTRPSVDTLSGPCQGLFEIRHKINRVQYRLIGFHGPSRGTATLIFGAREIGGRFEPRNTCEQAQRIRGLVESNPLKYRREHDYS